MVKISKSPERYTFQKEAYIARCTDRGEEPNPAYIRLYETWREEAEKKDKNPAWQKNNMEYDLRTSETILDKVRASETYAQNLYAAMCNVEWQSRDLWQELKGETWGCSWRYAGGIIADMREKGDYIDWYCSGIGSRENGHGLDEYKPDLDKDGRCSVPEGLVTEEVELDLNRLGWRPVQRVGDQV
jgi:hypothetical protein